MSKTPQGRESTRRRFLTQRHARAWIVLALVVALIAANADYAYSLYLIGTSGGAKRLALDIPVKLTILDILLPLLAILAISRRARGFAINAGSWLSLKLEMFVAPKRGKHAQKAFERRRVSSVRSRHRESNSDLKPSESRSEH